MILLPNSLRTFSGIGELGIYDTQFQSTTRQILPPKAGGAARLTDTEVMFQKPDPVVVGTVWARDVNTGAETLLDGEGGANFLSGDKGQWAAFLTKDTGRRPRGVRTSTGLLLPDAALFAVAFGCVFVRDSYQTGVGLSAYDINTHVLLWNEAGARPEEFFALDAQRCIWSEGGTVRVRGLDTPVQAQACFTPFVIEIGYELYLGGHADRGYVHPWNDPSMGWWLGDLNEGFGTTGARSGQSLYCVWSPNSGETVVLSRLIDPLRTAKESLVPTPPQPIPPDPTPIPPKPIPPKETKMLAIAEVLINVKTFTKAVQQSDGSYGFLQNNGKWASLDSFGNWSERDSVAGTDERFFPDAHSSNWLAPNRGGKTHIVVAVFIP